MAKGVIATVSILFARLSPQSHNLIKTGNGIDGYRFVVAQGTHAFGYETECSRSAVYNEHCIRVFYRIDFTAMGLKSSI